MKLLLPALLAPILMAIPAQAKVFRNAYIAFEMPETWKCNLEVTEWVCRAEQGKESKEAIIILTAKEVGPSDSFPLYENHLNQTIPLKLKTGATAESKIAYKAKTVTINDQPWIDGLHLGSEVPNYFTRYLATIKDKIAILVTLSAHKNYYTRYSQEFYKTVMSLKVVATKNLAGRPDLGPIRPGDGGMLGPGSVAGAMPGDLLEGDGLEGSGGAGGKAPFVILALVLAAAGGYMFLKKRKKG
ncbi:MAG: hypothetical protein KF789_14760 [Bdellovibrionaceae bacterium]|nr:hypothetical protein [Pseudobdellovibrionaceae bacterium]